MKASYIEIQRKKAYTDSFRDYKVFLNGKMVKKISQNESIQIAVNPGTHEIYLKIDWCRSKKLILKLSDREKVELICRGKSSFESWFCMFYMIFLPWKYISLEQKKPGIQLEESL